MAASTGTEIEIGDYVEAAALKSAKVPLLDLIIRSGRVAFTFEDASGEGTKALRAHRAGTLKVSSAAFAESLHTLKTAMFARRREAGLE